MLPKLLVQVVMVATSLLLGIHESQASLAKAGCQEMCGNVTILYPFGIGTNCYMHKSFEVFCSGSSQDQVPLLFQNNQEFPILEISTDLVRVIDESTMECGYNNVSFLAPLILDQYFFFSQDRNLYVAMGCNIEAYFLFDLFGGFLCDSFCNDTRLVIGSPTNCTGYNGCCQLSVPENTTQYNSIINYKANSSCSHAFIAENRAPIFFEKDQLQYPVALNWLVALTTCRQASKTGENLCGKNSHCIDSTNGRGYNCRCRQGYQGNPYLPNGCQDINLACPKQSNHYCGEGETCEYTHESYKCISPHHYKSHVLATLEIVIGLSASGCIGYWTYIKIGRIKRNKIKKKFFKMNGGHLLKKHISANKSCVTTIKVYTAEEMEKATKNFSRKMYLGKGGQGTVYKGLLRDETVVAIKKSNVVDVEQVARFVNEVFILAQINHRNIVKLLGCCLEYEVPLLVYEYLANDTLSQHLHDRVGLSTFSWKDRIRIAREVAGALAYLHSYASPAIIHRDIKPGNILLDQNYKAVVSDFGLSRSVPISKSHLTTQVDGTFGYLDPEYFESGKLTAKSDVYSFGLVLTELLTRKKSISSSDSGEGLVPRFKYLVKHNRLLEILDNQVVLEAMMDDVVLVAKLARRCMKRNSKKRPNMEEVVADLDKSRVLQLELPHECIGPSILPIAIG
ncbi:putative protein kinase RLK-Pelle-WAK family [Helianthus anomalus]